MSSRSHLSRVGRAVAVVLTALVFFALVNTRGVEWASAAGVVNDSRLRPGTVQQADLPAGWADNTDMAGSAAADLPTICGLALPAPRALAFSRFNDEEVGSVSSLVVLLRHGAAKSWLERLARIIKRGCTQSLETGLEGEDPIKVRVFAFAVPVMGDQRVGMRFSSDLPSTNETVIIRKGDLIVIVSSGRFVAAALPVLPVARRIANRLSSIQLP